MRDTQTAQEKAFAIGMSFSAFARAPKAVGTWEGDSTIIGMPTMKEEVAAEPMLVGRMCVTGWARFSSVVDLTQEQVFDYLVREWDKDTNHLSSTNEIVMSAPYQTIMAMGPPILPQIFRQLESEGDQPRNWFWALRFITRTNPVRPEQRGNRRAMARAWLDWGRWHYAW